MEVLKIIGRTDGRNGRFFAPTPENLPSKNEKPRFSYQKPRFIFETVVYLLLSERQE